MVPVGVFTFQLEMAADTSLTPILSAASLSRSTCTRTAYFCAPITCTCATPLIMEMRWPRVRSAYSFTSHMGAVSELSTMNMMGESAGLDLRKEGGDGMPGGSSGMAAEIAVCTSTAAPSILRSRSNWMVIDVEPREEVDVIESTPAMVVNCRSRGVATDDDIVCGSAPGRLAETERVGKSTAGRSLTGSAM